MSPCETVSLSPPTSPCGEFSLRWINQLAHPYNPSRELAIPTHVCVKFRYPKTRILYLLDRYICMTYTLIVIKSFGDSETEKIWNGNKSSRIPPEIHKRAFAKLLIIHSAESEDDLKIPPGNKFEHLIGKLKDYCSIRINNQWRIQFKFLNNEAYEVQVVDYH